MNQLPATHRRVLQVLQGAAGRPCSGPEIASQLGISRTAVWKHIRKLRANGYQILAEPRHGYRLVAMPDLLTPDELLPQLGTQRLGHPYYYVRTLGSTNDHALALASQGAPHGTLVVAEEQTQGRGRLKRLWHSPANAGIYLSLLLTDPLPVQQGAQVTLTAGLSLVKVLREHYGVQASLKWPNDVLVRRRKAAGILTEMQSDQDHIRFLVLGIGINVNQTTEQFAGPFRYPVTSLAMELGKPVPRGPLLALLLKQFESDYDRLVTRGFGALVPELEYASAILGEWVTVHSRKEDFCGRVLGFTPEGALRLLLNDRTEATIWVGDVTHIEGDFA